MALLQVKNLAEVRRKFKLLYGKNLKTAEARAMNKLVLTAAGMIKEAMSKVPVKHDSRGRITSGGSKPFGFPSVVSGNLRGNITGRVVQNGKGVMGLIGSMRKELEKGNYDIYLEFGTGRRGAADRGTINEEIYGKEFVQDLSFTTAVLGMKRRPYLEPIVKEGGTYWNKLNQVYQREFTKKTNTRI